MQDEIEIWDAQGWQLVGRGGRSGAAMTPIPWPGSLANISQSYAPLAVQHRAMPHSLPFSYTIRLRDGSNDVLTT